MRYHEKLKYTWNPWYQWDNSQAAKVALRRIKFLANTSESILV